MSSKESLPSRRAEFDEHVWDHTVDPFQTGFDIAPPLSDDHLAALAAVAEAVAAGADDFRIAEVLHAEIIRNAAVMVSFMKIAGLTRNKILTDLRAAATSRRLRIPSSAAGLTRSSQLWDVAGPYLAQRLRRVVEPLVILGSDLGPAFEAINQATWPHWIRQERAKRQGGEAESRIAIIFTKLDIPFEPLEKAENPLCRDAMLDGISYDLVVPSVANAKLVLKSTVQTSNIGQFGESKADLEVAQALETISAMPLPHPILLAMIDGVGFKSNTAGLHGVLENADEFCQFETIWKAAVIAFSQLGRKVALGLPIGHARDHAPFLWRYQAAIEVFPLNDRFRAEHENVDAGEAALALL